ncbi:hypothetical protein BDK51DRAFT_27049, partial [Blyttiomyces helicus]
MAIEAVATAGGEGEGGAVVAGFHKMISSSLRASALDMAAAEFKFPGGGRASSGKPESWEIYGHRSKIVIGLQRRSRHDRRFQSAFGLGRLATNSSSWSPLCMSALGAFSKRLSNRSLAGHNEEKRLRSLLPLLHVLALRCISCCEDMEDDDSVEEPARGGGRGMAIDPLDGLLFPTQDRLTDWRIWGLPHNPPPRCAPAMDWLFRWGNSSQDTVDKRSVAYLRLLHASLRRNLAAPKRTAAHREDLTNCLRELANLLVWADGDPGDAEILDSFIEAKIHIYLVKFLYLTEDDATILELLRFYNVFFESLRPGNFLWFFLSNSYMNDVISVKYNVENEEIASFVCTLLKNLSTKINPETASLFYNDVGRRREGNRGRCGDGERSIRKETLKYFFGQRLNDFPLFSEAWKYYAHEEGMLRIASRTIILNLFKVRDLARECASIVTCLKDGSDSAANLIPASIDTCLDQILFFQDLFELNLDHVARELSRALIDILVEMLVAQVAAGGRIK